MAFRTPDPSGISEIECCLDVGFEEFSERLSVKCGWEELISKSDVEKDCRGMAFAVWSISFKT